MSRLQAVYKAMYTFFQYKMYAEKRRKLTKTSLRIYETKFSGKTAASFTKLTYVFCDIK
jgi:hypothetical protein